MDLAELKRIAPEIDADLAAVFKKHNLAVDSRRASLAADGGSISMTLKLSPTNMVDAAGQPTTAERERFKARAASYGLDAGDLDRPFISNRKRFAIVGMKEGRASRNIICEREDGRRYVFDPASISRLLERRLRVVNA